MDDAPSFENYSYDELLDAKLHIDKHQYPERYNRINELLSNFDEKNGTSSEEIISNIDRYSTFWPRFLAALVDGVLFAFIIHIECLIFGVEYSREDSLIQALNGIQLSIYFIIMHGVYGQTLGKMAVGVEVLNYKDEGRIHISQAFKRESVNLALNSFWAILIVATTIEMDMYSTISQPLVFSAILFGILSILWALSEFVTMLFNNKRRALHDLIGGTVVVRT